MAAERAAAALAVLVGSGAAAPAPGLASCPAKPVPLISPKLPADVCIPDGFPGIALDYFDDYSWRALIALVWPAAPGRRGIAASSRSIGTAGPRVFETYKPLWETFHADGSAPASAFDRYDAAAANPCAADARFGDVTIGSASGIDDIGQAGIGVLDPPVVAHNGRYVRTLTLFTPMGEAQRRLLASYAGLIGRHAQSLLEDARSLDPRQRVYSPLGLAYGFCADMLSNMALDTPFARPAFDLTLEEMFASRGSLENKRARAEGWKTPNEQEGVRYPVDYSEGWRTQMFDRTTSALRARAEHKYRANASAVPDARLFVVPEADPNEPPAGRSVPDGIARAQEHCLTSDLQRALATGATAFPRGQILNDRNEGRFLASAESGGKWFGISKVVLTLCTSQGKDALLTGVPPPVVEALRLTCPGLAVTE